MTLEIAKKLLRVATALRTKNPKAARQLLRIAEQQAGSNVNKALKGYFDLFETVIEAYATHSKKTFPMEKGLTKNGPLLVQKLKDQLETNMSKRKDRVAAKTLVQIINKIRNNIAAQNRLNLERGKLDRVVKRFLGQKTYMTSSEETTSEMD